MRRLLVLGTSVLLSLSASAQQPPASPTQAETLAKWPWSISLQPTPFTQHTVTIALAPKEGMEFKYRLARGAGMLYSWTATGSVHWELHSQPDDAPPGYAEFFDTNDGSSSHGVYNAPFPGIHGWWWENQTDRDVRITLTTSGFYTEAHEFRKGVPVKVTTLN